jgi:CRISPR-associated protein Cas5d
MVKNDNEIEFVLYGKYALFSDPITRVGGEKCSYQIPTYQAIKGILESIYWKPTFIWYVDKVRVMERIQTESKGIRTIKWKPIKKDVNNDLSFYTYLKDVKYQVKAHFDWNFNRENLACDRNYKKHGAIASRSLERGGRRDIFLGTRECQGYVEPCKYGSGDGFYDFCDKEKKIEYGTLEFGAMFHSFDYPDETGGTEWKAKLWHAKMTNGEIEYPKPSDIPKQLCRNLREMGIKEFNLGVNMLGIDNEHKEVIADGLDE